MRAWPTLIGVLSLLALVALNPARAAEPAPIGEAFVGPFASWADLKRDYGAVGDGKRDDTPALQRALDDLRPPERKHFTLFIPAGTYRHRPRQEVRNVQRAERPADPRR